MPDGGRETQRGTDMDTKRWNKRLPLSVENHVRKSVAQGHFPTPKELIAFARQRGERLSRTDAALYIKHFRHLVQLSTKKHKSRWYSTLPFPLYGVIFVDIAFIFPQFKGKNDGCVGFVMAVEASTQQMYVHPLRKKDMESWREIIEGIVNSSTFDGVKTICSDAEPSLISRQFRNEMMEKRGIKLMFIRNRNKSYYSELFIRWFKNAISKTTKQRKLNGEENWQRWIDVVPNIVKYFNKKIIKAIRDICAMSNGTSKFPLAYCLLSQGLLA